MVNRELKIAILCSGYEFDRWEAESIRQVIAIPNVRIVALIREVIEESPKPIFLSRIFSYPYSILSWRWMNRFGLKISSLEKVSLEKELNRIPVIDCKPEVQGKYSQHISSNDLLKIREYSPDIILRFAFNILRGEILTMAPYGVWSFHHADEQIIRGGPAAFWEIYFNIPRTGAILQRLTEKLDAGIILRKGHFRTIRRSYKANLDQLLMGTSSWMKQAVIDAQLGISPALKGTPIFTSAVIYKFPRNGQMFRLRWIQRKEKLKFHWNELFKAEKWNIAVINQAKHELVNAAIVRAPKWLPEYNGPGYFADPFGWKDENNVTHIVAEEYDYRTRKGIISTIAGEKKKLIEEKHHLSYPFVIQNGNAVQLLPEAFQSGELSVYDLNGNKKTLLENFAAVDATPFEYNGKWWIFCTEGGDLSNTALHIFHADSFDSEWKAHANNPVKWDIGSARPAGTPFMIDAKLYRPSQDCSTTYGAAVVINEVTELSESSFKEIQVSRVEPGKKWKYNKGLHTISFIDDDTMLIDAKRTAFNFPNFSFKLGRKMKKLFGA